MLPTAVLPLVQLPPPEISLKVVVRPTQTELVPVIAAGKGFTTRFRLTEQPVEVNVKVIVALPAVTAVKNPVDEPIVATPVALLDQVPAPETSL
jgi:hypothetical protein